MSKGIPFTPELFTKICDGISDGRSLRSVCGDEGIPSKSVVLDWIAKDATLADQYARACEERAEYLAESALIEAYNENIEAGAVARDRLKVDTIKWFASKVHPKKYGDRVQNDHAGRIAIETTPDLSKLSDAELRLLAEIQSKSGTREA
jgi:hypothetical protein